ncbi:8725_t:CDS:1, partial [Acaulospora morrowiae]
SPSSEDSANKTKKTRTKNEAEEVTVEKPEVKGQSKQTTQYDEKKGKSKKKPQANESLREEDNKDTKFKKKKSSVRDSGLGEMPVDPIPKKHLKYGYFDQESEGDGRGSNNRRRSAQADDDDDNLPALVNDCSTCRDYLHILKFL